MKNVQSRTTKRIEWDEAEDDGMKCSSGVLAVLQKIGEMEEDSAPYTVGHRRAPPSCTI